MCAFNSHTQWLCICKQDVEEYTGNYYKGYLWEMGLTEASLGGGGQLLSKYKLCALNPVKVTNYFCDKGSKNCW